VPNKVLLIDDDPALVRMIRLALLSEGLGVSTAPTSANGTGGGIPSSTRPADAELDGRASSAYRARGGTTPIILLSAYMRSLH
jgi:DNA-binding response OmpR family regulator